MRPVNTLVKLLLAAGGVDAFFRVTCSPFKRERIDPVVNFGVESKHMHTFFGNRGISANTASGDELRNNDACTSCTNQLDRSSYWMPTLYYGLCLLFCSRHSSVDEGNSQEERHGPR